MAILDIARGQSVRIPAIMLTNRREFQGVIRASDGETLVVELEPGGNGVIPNLVPEKCKLVWESEGIQRTCSFLVRSKSSRALVGQVVIDERRQSPRVRAEMQLVYEIVPADSVKEVADEVMAQVNTLGDPKSEVIQMLRTGDDPIALVREEIAALRDLIGEMMVKLDSLTAVVTGVQPGAAIKTTLKPVSILNCSSTGLGFLSAAEHAQGSYVRLHMTLRTVPQTVIDCMGVIMRCAKLPDNGNEAGEERFNIGVRFTHIHESDRERLIQYLFKVQRRMLRDLRETREMIKQQ